MTDFDPTVRTPLLLGLGLVVLAGLLEIVSLIAPAGAYCGGGGSGGGFMLGLFLTVPVLWLAGLVSLLWASRAGEVSAGAGFVGVGGAVVVAVMFVPTLGHVVAGCFQ